MVSNGDLAVEAAEMVAAIEWTPRMERRFRESRWSGVPIQDWAARFGLCYRIAAVKARELGAARKGHEPARV